MNDHAVVIGGSIAGLLSARSLSEYFNKVTVLERDEFPDGPDFRKGVPQGRHFHFLLAKGLELLDALFPNFHHDLVAAGAVPLELGTDGRWLLAAGWAAIGYVNLQTYTCSRTMLEWLVRQRLMKFHNITFIDQADAHELMTNTSKSIVTGVRVQSRKHGDTTITDISADLVVDASGRSSKLPEWLVKLGYAVPPQTIIDSFLGYATRTYKIPENFKADWKAIFLFPNPPQSSRGGALFPLEDNNWIVTLGGAAKQYPPTDEVGFLEYARSLRDPMIYDIIKNAEPLTPIYGYQRTQNQLRHYERMPRFPERLIALGDAVCAFNPIYGQGMTTAALGAMLLKQELEKVDGNLTGFSRSFRKALAKSNENPWLLATSTDMLYPTTEGGQTNAIIRFQQWYINALMPLALTDSDLYKDITGVLHLLYSPLILFKPKRIVQLVARMLSGKRTESVDTAQTTVR